MWPSQPTVDHRTATEWAAFCKVPFGSITGYSNYVLELAKIGATYGDLLIRKNSSSISAMEILKNGASREHFEFLQNSSRLLARLGSRGSRLATGTTRNEQLHRELKSWSRNFYQSHKGRLQNGFRIFEFVKLLTHASAAYSPTLTQRRQCNLLSLISGRMRQIRFFPSLITNLHIFQNQLPLSRVSLQASYLQTNTSKSLL